MNNRQTENMRTEENSESVYLSSIPEMLDRMESHHDRIKGNPIFRTVRGNLGLPDDAICVLLGEQPYFYGGNPKVVNKRFLADILRLEGSKRGLDIKIVEYFAAGDGAKSEDPIRAVSIPEPFRETGEKNIGIGHKKLHTEQSVSGVKLSELHDKQDKSSLIDLATEDAFKAYPGAVRDIRLERLLGQLYQQSDFGDDRNRESLRLDNLAGLNVHALNQINQLMGLETTLQTTDNSLDTRTLLSGGLQFLMKNWPKIVAGGNLHLEKNPGIMQPLNPAAAPFWYVSGGVRHRVVLEGQGFVIQTLRGQEVKRFANPEELLQAVRQDPSLSLPVKALPRVILYSRAFDGHITGGGSRYNQIALPAAADLGLDLFPLIHNGSKLFEYNSVRNRHLKKSTAGSEQSARLVAENSVGTIDVLLSCGIDEVRAGLRRHLENSASFQLGEPVKLSDEN